MKITSLERAKTSNRINVYVDDKFSFAVEESTLTKAGLYKDKYLDLREIEEIKKNDVYFYGLKIATKYLDTRRRSIFEIRQYLIKKLKLKDLDTNLDIIITSIIDKLIELELVNDQEFALWVIKSMIEKGNKSPREIEQKLIKFGILRETYTPIINKELTGDQEKVLIKKLILKKLKTSKIKSLPKKERKLKIMYYLTQKGFNIDNIYQVLNNLNY